jgi:hypothetical protein
MEAAVSSSALACCSVRADRSWLPWAISALLPCPQPAVHGADGSNVFIHVRLDADHPDGRSGIHRMALQALAGAVFLDRDVRNNGPQNGAILRIMVQLIQRLAAGQHGAVQVIHNALLGQPGAVLIVNALGADHTQFLDAVRDGYFLQKQRTRLGIADEVLAVDYRLHQRIERIDDPVGRHHRPLLGHDERTFLDLVRKPELRADQNDQQKTLNQDLQLELQSDFGPTTGQCLHGASKLLCVALPRLCAATP